MKILLDIDGVMIPAKSWQTHEKGSDGFGMFSKFSVESLNRIIENSTNPEIILTTSHKHVFSLAQWKNIFSNRGVKKVNLRRLSTNTLNTPRIDEIRSWYLQNLNEKFIVIDDDKSLNKIDSDFKENYLILTNATVGLNRLTADEAISKIKLLEKSFH